MYPVVPSVSSNSAPPNWRLFLCSHRKKNQRGLGAGRLAGRQHGSVGHGSAADLSELSEVARTESDDIETSREALVSRWRRWVHHRMRVREQLGYLLSSRVQSAGQVSPTRLSLP